MAPGHPRHPDVMRCRPQVCACPLASRPTSATSSAASCSGARAVHHGAQDGEGGEVRAYGPLLTPAGPHRRERVQAARVLRPRPHGAQHRQGAGRPTPHQAVGQVGAGALHTARSSSRATAGTAAAQGAPACMCTPTAEEEEAELGGMVRGTAELPLWGAQVIFGAPFDDSIWTPSSFPNVYHLEVRACTGCGLSVAAHGSSSSSSSSSRTGKERPGGGTPASDPAGATPGSAGPRESLQNPQQQQQLARPSAMRAVPH